MFRSVAESEAAVKRDNEKSARDSAADNERQRKQLMTVLRAAGDARTAQRQSERVAAGLPAKINRPPPNLGTMLGGGTSMMKINRPPKKLMVAPAVSTSLEKMVM